MTTRVLLTRHGETVSNVQRRYTGHTETPLTPRGQRQAKALARRLGHEQIDAIYASDLTRAAETARLAVGERELEIVLEPRLREMSFGDWEGKNFEEVRAGWPDDHQRLRTIGKDFQAPGGEPFSATTERIVAALDDIVARHKEQTVLVVSHGGTVQVILQHVLNLPEGSFFRLQTSNCGLTELEYRGERAFVIRVNDTAHLERRRRRTAP